MSTTDAGIAASATDADLAGCATSGHPSPRPAGGVAPERLRVLDTWIGARARTSLDGTAVHDLLTHVVDEVHEICNTIGHELLGVAR